MASSNKSRTHRMNCKQGIDIITSKSFFFSFLVLLFLICPTVISHSAVNQQCFHRLYINLEQQLSPQYTSTENPGYQTYVEACERAPVYPYYAYKKLLVCYSLLSINRVQYCDNQSTCYQLLNNITCKLSNLSDNITNLPFTLSSFEWISIAHENINTVNNIILAKVYTRIDHHDYSVAIQQLHLADAMLENARHMICIGTNNMHSDTHFIPTWV